MVKTKFLIVFLLLLGFHSKSQYRGFLSVNYMWDHPMEVPELQSIYTYESAVSLKEQNRIALRGLKSEFMYIYVEQKGIIQFNDQKGVSDHGHFLFPNTFDEPYERQFIPINEEAYGPYFNVKIMFMGGRILKADGTLENAIFKYSFPDTYKIIGEEFERVYRYHIEVTNLEPGDALEYHYKYEIPMDVNWMHFNSGRIFHHGDIPKQEYELKLESHKNLRNMIIGDEWDEKTTEDKVIKHIWKKKNLPAVMDEVASRPHLDLPHVIYKFNENNLSYIFQHPRTGQILPEPFYTYMIKKRQSRDHWFRRVARRNLVLDRQGFLFRNWVSDVSLHAGDPLEKLRLVQSDIAQNFKYEKDLAYYRAQDMGLERIGTFISHKKLRDISRQNVYTKLFNHLKFDEYKVLYPMDNRTGILSKDFSGDIYFGERLFYSNDSNAVFAFPKRSQLGYELNETPFYWQGTSALGYTLDELFNEDIQAFRTTVIPIDTSRNIRSANVIVLVNLDEKTLGFSTDLKLKGQFSTLTRGAYLYNEIDSTINSNYADKIFEVGGKIYLKKNDLASLESIAPFTSEFDLEYSAVDKVSIKENEIFIPLNGLFNFVLWDKIDFENRHSTFYPDFAFEDVFNYTLVFDSALESGPKESASIQNTVGSFSYSIEHLSDAELIINASWTMTGNPIPADNISELEGLYKAIKEFQKKVLNFKIKD